MKILFLDDDRKRISIARQFAIGHDFTAVETVNEAVSQLNQSTFDIISLDHDLGGEVYCKSDEKSGYEVAKHVAALPVEKLPKKVIVHSFNPGGAENMMKALAPIGRKVRVIRRLFGDGNYGALLTSRGGF